MLLNVNFNRQIPVRDRINEKQTGTLSIDVRLFVYDDAKALITINSKLKDDNKELYYPRHESDTFLFLGEEIPLETKDEAGKLITKSEWMRGRTFTLIDKRMTWTRSELLRRIPDIISSGARVGYRFYYSNLLPYYFAASLFNDEKTLERIFIPTYNSTGKLVYGLGHFYDKDGRPRVIKRHKVY